jgi:hypothetical protein
MSAKDDNEVKNQEEITFGTALPMMMVIATTLLFGILYWPLGTQVSMEILQFYGEAAAEATRITIPTRINCVFPLAHPLF